MAEDAKTINVSASSYANVLLILPRRFSRGLNIFSFFNPSRETKSMNREASVFHERFMILSPVRGVMNREISARISDMLSIFSLLKKSAILFILYLFAF